MGLRSYIQKRCQERFCALKENKSKSTESRKVSNLRASAVGEKIAPSEKAFQSAQHHGYVIELVSIGTKLIFALVAGTVLWFRFSENHVGNTLML